MWTPKEVAETMIKAEKFDKNAQTILAQLSVWKYFPVILYI